MFLAAGSATLLALALLVLAKPLKGRMFPNRKEARRVRLVVERGTTLTELREEIEASEVPLDRIVDGGSFRCRGSAPAQPRAGLFRQGASRHALGARREPAPAAVLVGGPARCAVGVVICRSPFPLPVGGVRWPVLERDEAAVEDVGSDQLQVDVPSLASIDTRPAGHVLRHRRGYSVGWPSEHVRAVRPGASSGSTDRAYGCGAGRLVNMWLPTVDLSQR